MTLSITRTKVHYIALFFSVILFAPLIGNQLITGTIVNAILFSATVIIGLRAGFILSIVPSIVAIATGLLPIVLAPIIPYIVISNIILVTVFSKIENKILAMVVASMAKFAFLFIISHFVLTYLINSNLLAIMFSYTQLFTAIMGGSLALLLLKLYGKK
ncbi:MAG: iron hydrogenase [Candidatus Pacebacteria bacterium]|nr:iron hydrogenase [Candidatus Paceibacterota bacterium]